jgi:hypothetical protein
MSSFVAGKTRKCFNAAHRPDLWKILMLPDNVVMVSSIHIAPYFLCGTFDVFRIVWKIFD